MWMGLPDTLETLVSKYDVDDAYYIDTLNQRLAQASAVYTLPITKTNKIDAANVKLCNAEQSKQLHTAFAKARSIKADWEVEIIRKANEISSIAHAKVNIFVIKRDRERERTRVLNSIISAFLVDEGCQGWHV